MKKEVRKKILQIRSKQRFVLGFFGGEGDTVWALYSVQSGMTCGLGIKDMAIQNRCLFPFQCHIIISMLRGIYVSLIIDAEMLVLIELIFKFFLFKVTFQGL